MSGLAHAPGFRAGGWKAPSGDESETDWLSPWPLLGAGHGHFAEGASASYGAQVGAAGFFDAIWRWLTGPFRPNEQWNLTDLFGSAGTAKAMIGTYNGAGVHVGVYDDGIDKSVSALMTHYDASRELVFGGSKADPGILADDGQGIHGTATNGIIAADPTKTGGRVTGIANGCSLTDVNIFSGIAASNMSEAIRQMANFDVTNNSWGWANKWADLGAWDLVAHLAYAGTDGRGGLGTVIVKAAGNDWRTDHRDVATQELNVDRHVITVGAMGIDHDVTTYSQRGASLLTSAPGGTQFAGITTTDRPGRAGYVNGDINPSFTGTSAAAPEVTAVVADMLGANGKLGARDVQAIIALASHDNETSRFTTAATGNMAYGWTVNHADKAFNGGGYHFSNDEGFGELNAHDAIREALAWTYMNPVAQTFNNEVHLSATAPGQTVPADAAGTRFTFAVTGSEIVENADLTLNVATANLDHLKVVLTSASGTQSIVLDTSFTARGGYVVNHASGVELTLGSHAFLGEAAQGTWTAQVIDTTSGDALKINAATLDLYGSAPSRSHQFHFTDEAAMMDADDPGRLTLNDPTGVDSWIDTAMMTGLERIDLHSGSASYENGRAFLTIGRDTVIDKATLGDGVCTVLCNDNGDTIVGGGGAALIQGGRGNDTFIAGSGREWIAGSDGADTFVFDHSGFGSVTITDFAKGADHLDLRGLGADLRLLQIADSGSTIQISHIDAAGDTILLTNSHNQHLGASDFLFA